MWFSKRNKKVTRGRKWGRTPEWDPTRTLIGIRVLTIVGFMLCLVLAWGWGQPRLMRYAQSAGRHPLAEDRVVLSPAPMWMSTALQDALRSIVARQLLTAPVKHRLTQAARQLEDDPWVKRVVEIRRVSQRTVVVTAQYRVPRAVVQDGTDYYLIDEQAVRLPGVYERHHLEPLNLPVIVAVASGPPPVGDAWPGQDLRSGVSLASLLVGQPYAPQVKAIDVSGRDRRGRIRLVLLTRHGMVRWGFPPGQEQAIEPDAETKLDRLEAVYHRCGSVDAGDKVVDVYGAAIFVHPQSFS